MDFYIICLFIPCAILLFYFIFTCSKSTIKQIPAGIYLLKNDNRNTRLRCEIYSELTNGVFIVNFEHISQPVLVLTLNIQLPAWKVKS